MEQRFQGVGWCFQGVSMYFEACLKAFEGCQRIADAFHYPPPKLVEVGPGPSRSVLGLSQDSNPSIEPEATQIIRNVTDPGIEVGRAPFWGRPPSEIFWREDKEVCLRFFTFGKVRHLFPTQANKSHVSRSPHLSDC